MWNMPQLPPELLAQLSRGNGAPPVNGATTAAQPSAQPAAPMNGVPGTPGAFGPPKPIQMGMGGRNLNPPPPADPASSPGGMVAGANVPAASPFTRTPKPESSDDPGITGMPALPTPPDTSNSPITQAYQRYQDIEKTRPPVPDASKLKPKLWERLAGAGVGFASGWGNAERGAQLGGDVTSRRYDAAMRDYTHQNAAVDQKEAAERGGLPFAEAAAKTPQQAFENAMQRTRLGTEQKVGQGRIDRAEAQAAKLQDQIDNPKEATPKNADEALVAAMNETDPGKKTAKMAIAQALHQQEIDRVLKARPPKADPDKPKPATRNQFREVDDRRKSADDKAEEDFGKATKDIDLTTPHNAKGTPEGGTSYATDQAYAADKATYDREVARLEQRKKQNEKAYYEDIRDLGGEAPSGPAKPAASAAQPAKPAASPERKPVDSLGGYKAGDVVTLKGGQKVRIRQLFSDRSFEHEPAK
jgi:hypothetical protein